MRAFLIAGFLSLAVLVPARATAADTLADTLAFEAAGPAEQLVGWGGGPMSTLLRDATVVHGGRYAARIERSQESESTFSSATRGRFIRFTGSTLELRGWLKTRDVQGFAGLWLREDSNEQNAVQFDNMYARQLSGTTDWTEYRIVLPLDTTAVKMVYGVILSGTGTVWADDLQLLVDGRPIEEAPRRERPQTAVDLDHEFDEGSRIETATLSPAQVEHLALLAKVWGFLKYHHPAVTRATFSWDYELFRVMPAVLEARDNRGALHAIVQWMDRIGEPTECNPCASLPDTLALRPPIDWIRDDRRLGKALSQRLQKVHANRPTTSTQHYVSFVRGISNPAFTNERGYAQHPNPDAGYRLLALFRFWNIIEYWFPYRDLIDEDWDHVLADLIPRVILAEDSRSYRRLLMELAVRVDDGHAGGAGAGGNHPPEGDCRLAAALRHVEGRFVVHAWADSTQRSTSGLEVGDVLVSIDGRAVDALVAEIAPYYSASNETGRMRNIALSLTNGPCGPCELEVERDGTLLRASSRRLPRNEMNAWAAAIHDLPGPTFQLLTGNVAYIKLSNITAGSARGYIEQAAGTKGLIIDIRNYPSAFMPFELGGHLVSKPTPFARFTRGDPSNPGAFLWTVAVSIQPLVPHYEGKVVVLVDEASVSQSEYTAMAFRAAGATVIGSQTAGADGNVSGIPIPGGITMRMSGIGVFYPDRKPTQQIGIVPDIVVTPNLRGIRAREDAVLDAALRHILAE